MGLHWRINAATSTEVDWEGIGATWVCVDSTTLLQGPVIRTYAWDVMHSSCCRLSQHCSPTVIPKPAPDFIGIDGTGGMLLVVEDA